MYIIEQDRYIPIGLSADFSWVYDSAEYPMSVAAYEQNEYGTLAWVFEFIHKNQDGYSVSIRLPFKNLDNGAYLILDEIINANFDYKFSIKPKTHNKNLKLAIGLAPLQCTRITTLNSFQRCIVMTYFYSQEVTMFTLWIEEGLQLALVSPAFAPRYLEIVRREREYLGQWLAWTPHAENEEFFLNFIKRS